MHFRFKVSYHKIRIFIGMNELCHDFLQELCTKNHKAELCSIKKSLKRKQGNSFAFVDGVEIWLQGSVGMRCRSHGNQCHQLSWRDDGTSSALAVISSRSLTFHYLRLTCNPPARLQFIAVTFNGIYYFFLSFFLPIFLFLFLFSSFFCKYLFIFNSQLYNFPLCSAFNDRVLLLLVFFYQYLWLLTIARSWTLFMNYLIGGSTLLLHCY